nr:uncharacterized protein LOC127348830 isoform X2 [Lolium perenne]
MLSYTARSHTSLPALPDSHASPQRPDAALCLSHDLAWPHSASSSATTGPHGFQLPAATSSSAELARHLAPGRSKYSIERLFHQLPRQLHAQTGAESRPAACYPMTGPHGFGPPATPTRHLQTISPPPPGRCQRSTEKLMKWWRISRSEDWSTEIKITTMTQTNDLHRGGEDEMGLREAQRQPLPENQLASTRCLAYRDDGIGSRRKRPERCRRCARRGSLQRMTKAAVRQVDENAAVSGVMQLPPASQLAWRRCRHRGGEGQKGLREAQRQPLPANQLASTS